MFFPKAAITILSPELGAHLANPPPSGEGHQDDEGGVAVGEEAAVAAAVHGVDPAVDIPQHEPDGELFLRLRGSPTVLNCIMPSVTGASTSGVSTVNSAGGAGAGAGAHGGGAADAALVGGGAAGGLADLDLHHHPHHRHHHQPHGEQQLVHHQLLQLRRDNDRLLSQLLDLQRSYQDLLRHNLSEQSLHIQALSRAMRQAGQMREMWRWVAANHKFGPKQ